MKKYKKKLMFYKFFKIIFLLLVILTFSFILLRVFVTKASTSIISNTNYNINEPISFLLIGSDYLKNNPDGARADSLMVATLNPSNARGNIEFEFVSIPRDTIAYLPCGPQEDTYEKITHSFMYGIEEGENGEDIDSAIACTKESVEDLLNIQIDHYVAATFSAVIEMVDAIDGIDVNSSRAFCGPDEENNGYSPTGDCVEGSLHFTKGEQHLDGQYALAYARERADSTDYDRNLRQQEVVSAIAKKILKNPVKYSNDFIRVFKENCKTDININDIRNYISFVVALYNNIYINLSEDVGVYIDQKSSIYENNPMYYVSTVIDNSNNSIKPVTLEELYGEENIDDFEKYTYASRHNLTKENMKSPTNVAGSLKIKKNLKSLKPITIEYSSFSIRSTEVGDSYTGFYSYFDPDTLYYVSNMLRKSLNLEEEDIDYNYDMLTLYYGIIPERNPDFLALEGIEDENTVTDSLLPFDDGTNYNSDLGYGEVIPDDSFTTGSVDDFTTDSDDSFTTDSDDDFTTDSDDSSNSETDTDNNTDNNIDNIDNETDTEITPDI